MRAGGRTGVLAAMRFALAAMKTLLPTVEAAALRLADPGALAAAPEGAWVAQLEARLAHEGAGAGAGEGAGAALGARLTGLCVQLRSNGPTRRYLVCPPPPPPSPY